MTRAEKYKEIFGLPCPYTCMTDLCENCPMATRCNSNRRNDWWNSEYVPTEPEDTPKITISFSKISKESICDELIGFITTAFSPNNSIQYALGISDCLKMIEDFKKEASKE